MKETIEEAIRTGRVLPWQQQWGDPHQVSAMGCAQDDNHKKRATLAPLVLNFFERYRSFSQERLQDVEDYVLAGYHLWKWDAKAGYHMLFINPAYWKYLCFQWEGRVYCWTCLPFGLQSACRTYSIVMGELHRLEREIGGGLLSFVIDDKLGAARTLWEACYRCLTGVMMMGAAGVVFSLDKCELWPQQLVKWLGLLLHTTPFPHYSVPEGKLQRLYDMIVQLQQRQEASARELAQLAGKIVSLAAAIQLPRLLARALYLTITGHAAWEQLLQLPHQLQFFLRWLRPLVQPGGPDCINGERWLKEPRAMSQLHLVVDTSESAHAGCLLKGGSLEHEIQVAFSREQCQAARRHEWGSTPRETAGIKHALLAMESQEGVMQQLQHTRLRIICDSQGTIQVLDSMGGSNWEQLYDVHAIWTWLLRHDVQPVWVWQPRDSPEVRLADALSKQPDAHDWILSQQVFNQLGARQLPGRQGGQWGAPTVDLFASAGNHKCDRFFTPYLCTGAAGVDAFAADWGQEQLAYIFAGPLYKPGPIVSKIMHDRCSCILVVPRWHQYWRAMLVGPHVRDSWDLKFFDGLYMPGPRVPAHLHNLRVPLIAYRIDFAGL